MNPVTNGATREQTHSANRERMIVFEYYDGPVEGVIEFGEAAGCFASKCSTQNRELSTNGKTRDFVFQPLPADALDRIVIAIEPYIAPTWPVWCRTLEIPFSKNRGGRRDDDRINPARSGTGRVAGFEHVRHFRRVSCRTNPGHQRVAALSTCP